MTSSLYCKRSGICSIYKIKIKETHTRSTRSKITHSTKKMRDLIMGEHSDLPVWNTCSLCFTKSKRPGLWHIHNEIRSIWIFANITFNLIPTESVNKTRFSSKSSNGFATWHGCRVGRIAPSSIRHNQNEYNVNLITHFGVIFAKHRHIKTPFIYVYVAH